MQTKFTFLFALVLASSTLAMPNQYGTPCSSEQVAPETTVAAYVTETPSTTDSAAQHTETPCSTDSSASQPTDLPDCDENEDEYGNMTATTTPTASTDSAAQTTDSSTYTTTETAGTPTDNPNVVSGSQEAFQTSLFMMVIGLFTLF